MKYLVISLILSVTLIMNGANAQPVTLKQLGKPNEYIQAGYQVYYNRALYTFTSGALYKTELDIGHCSRLGNSVYNNIRFFLQLITGFIL